MTSITADIRREALTKLAFYGYAGVPGTPAYSVPDPSVGQILYNINTVNNVPSYTGNSYITPMHKRHMSDDIVSTGINVNAPASSLLRAGLGALAGNFVANALHTGPFVRGIMTAAGANYGYNR